MVDQKSIKRFRQPIAAGANMIPEPSGPWCLYEDYLAALGEAEEERDALRHTMLEAASKLEEFGNEEPLAVAATLRQCARED